MTAELDLEEGLSKAPRAVTVKVPREGLPGAAIAGTALLAAVLLFMVLDAGRSEKRPDVFRQSSSHGAIVSPPELAVPSESGERRPGVGLYSGEVARPVAIPRSVIAAAPVAAPPTPDVRRVPAPPYQDSLTAPAQSQTLNFPPLPSAAPRLTFLPPSPALILDRGVRRPGSPSTSAPQGSSSGPIRPEPANFSPTLLTAGTLLPAVLETPLDTSRAGLARALVTTDTRGADGTLVVVPKGSRLIGQYGADASPGQDRVLVTWNTLVLPDGRQVRIEAPSADARGAPGIPGKVHSNSLGRFFNSLFQSALNIATFRAIDTTSRGSVVVAVPGSVSGASQTLLPAETYHRSITVPAGAELTVFVSQDIDFAGADDLVKTTP